MSWAVKYQRTPLPARLFRKPLLKACACFLVIASIFGIVFFRDEDGKEVSSPFVLSVYAASPDGDSTSVVNVLKKGEPVPITTFETENGLTGFVVSYNKTDDHMPSSIAILSAGDHKDSIDEIMDFAMNPTQNYYFYVPNENEVEPYIFPLFLTDTEANLVFQYTIKIMQIDGSYYAELMEKHIVERVIK